MQNLQENACVVVFFINLQVEKTWKMQLKHFTKLTRIHVWCSLIFNKVADWKSCQNSQKKNRTGVSFWIRLQSKGTASTSNCWFLEFFESFIIQWSFMYHLCCILLLITRKFAFFQYYIKCRKFVVMVFKENSKSNKNQNQTQNQTEFLLIIAKKVGFSSSISDWSMIFFKWKICFLEIPQISLFLWAMSSQWKTLLFSFLHIQTSLTNLLINYFISQSVFL